MHVVLHRCRVDLDGQGKPWVLHWRKRTYRVTQVLNTWRMSGRWWLQEPPRTCWRLKCEAFTVVVHQFERTHPPSQLSGWWVARVQD